MNTLTARQSEILSWVSKYVVERGFPPSIREIGAAFGINSLRGVTVTLDALERKGYLRLEPAVPRGLQVLRTPSSKSMNKTIIHRHPFRMSGSSSRVPRAPSRSVTNRLGASSLSGSRPVDL